MPRASQEGVGMNQYEHHSHISITRHTREGVTRTDVHIAQIGSFSGEDGDPEGVEAVRDGGHECFDPESCCDAQERALIAMMRAYLRPSGAGMSDRAVASHLGCMLP